MKDHPFWESSTDIDINGSPGAGLVVIPAASKYLDAGGFVYRRGDGKVYNYLADRKGNTTGFAWGSGMSFCVPRVSLGQSTNTLLL